VTSWFKIAQPTFEQGIKMSNDSNKYEQNLFKFVGNLLSTSAQLKNEMSAQTEGEIQNLINVNDFGARSDWQTSVRRR